MELAKIAIRNYKSIEFAEIQIENIGNSYLKILLGKNESGKSNILDAIDIKQKYSNRTSEKLIVDNIRRQDLRDSDEIYVEFYFRIDIADIDDKKGCYYPFIVDRVREYGKGDNLKAILKEYSAEFAIEKYEFSRIANSNNYNVSRTVLVKLNKSEARGNYFKSSSFSGSTNDLFKTTFITNLEYNKLNENLKKSLSILQDNDIAFIHSIVLNEHLLKNFPVFLWTANNRYIINNPVPVEDFLNRIDSYPLLKFVFSEDKFDSEGKIKEKFSTLNLSNERVSYEKHLSEIITKRIKGIWKDSNINFNVRLENNEIITTIKEDNNEQLFIDLKDRSSGFKQIITLLFDLLFYIKDEKDKKPLLLIDEPENHLHPSAIKELFDFILNFGIQNYVIISTHSPFFLDKQNTSRHNVVKKENGHTIVSSIDENHFVLDDYVTNTCFGFNIWNELLGTKIILVEGSSDKVIISKLIDDINIHNDIRILGGKGANVVRFARIIRQIHNNFIVIVDSDKDGQRYKKQIKEYDSSIHCYALNDIYEVIKDCTIEDWINNDFIIKEINNKFDEIMDKFGIPKGENVFSIKDNENFTIALSRFLNNYSSEFDEKKISRDFIIDSLKEHISQSVKNEDINSESIKNLNDLIIDFFKISINSTNFE
ncbi:AAA family ATPase [Succinivibrio dextrinosolvens]|uniref:Predicted ATP-dependent endonuclease of the OLD family, contains P-loop ATPase and TOPRIM domains n=1 Tax=Succinivibrio dextrinosolvens TaxID=83771 RepID=A0A662ZF50_9GAMM|nr:AAA family ATPase [Succinivibrio dextrinosolvens]SFK54568.1 Predicted ATP-dependent endonuclease of the OLD family, contains P-loop ATPase and TOPRIM domains [Succinivibrio dextrinosolvens]